MKFNTNAKEEKKTNDAKRAKRKAEMSAVHKRAREVREEFKKLQRCSKVEKVTERGYEDRGPQMICGGADEPAVERKVKLETR